LFWIEVAGLRAPPRISFNRGDQLAVIEAYFKNARLTNIDEARFSSVDPFHREAESTLDDVPCSRPDLNSKDLDMAPSSHERYVRPPRKALSPQF